MMHRIAATICFLLSAGFAYADPGSRFCARATVTTHDNDILTGYIDFGGFDLSLLRDSTGYRYFKAEGWLPVRITEEKAGATLRVAATEKHFFEYVLAILEDSIRLYPDVFLIPFEEEGYPVPAYVGAAKVISKNKIKSVSVSTLTECSVLYGSLTQLTLQDEWVTGTIFRTDDLGQIGCIYHAFYYSSPTSTTDGMIDQLKEILRRRADLGSDPSATLNSFAEMEDLIATQVGQLKRSKVVIIFTCSC